MPTTDVQSFINRNPTFIDGNYILPNDAKELERLEKQHKAFIALAKGQLIVAPVRKAISKVVDIGCGTGVVTRELRRHFADADHIYGIDLTPVNLEYEHHDDDVSEMLTSSPEFIQGDFMTLAGADSRLSWGSTDFAWSRFLVCGLTDWQGYTDRVFKLLNPGAWAQMVDFCDDFHFDPLHTKRPPDFAAKQEWGWLRALREVGYRRGLDLDAGLNIPMYMENSGFTDIQTMNLTVPYWVGALKMHPEARLALEFHVGDPYGLYWHMIPKMLENMGYDEEQIRQFQLDSQRDCCEEPGKYQTLYITIGRKPEV